MLFLPEMGMLVPERSSVPSVRFKGSLLPEPHQISEGIVDMRRCAALIRGWGHGGNLQTLRSEVGT